MSQSQLGTLCDAFDALDLDPEWIRRDRSVELEQLGGFLALTSPWAGTLCQRLKTRGIWTDFRNRVLRLGPAPYLGRRQLLEAIETLGELVSEVAVESG